MDIDIEVFKKVILIWKIRKIQVSQKSLKIKKWKFYSINTLVKLKKKKKNLELLSNADMKVPLFFNEKEIQLSRWKEMSL